MSTHGGASRRQQLQLLAAAAALLYGGMLSWWFMPASQASVLHLPSAPHQIASSVYVMHGHNASAALLTAFQSMQHGLGADRTFLVFDDTRGAWPFGDATRITQPRGSGSPNVLLFNRTEATAVMGNVKEEMQYWDQPALVLFYRHINPYLKIEHVWWIEDDVRCHGDWTRCLETAEALPHDLLCSHAPTQNVDGAKDWHWLRLAGNLAAVPLERRRGCFMPLMRMSHRALELMSREMGSSSGFLEVYIPTLLDSAGMSMALLPSASVGWIGLISLEPGQPAVPPDNRVYHPIKPCGTPLLAGGAFECRSAVPSSA